MKFVAYTDWSQLPESANALFARREKDSIFFSRRWLESLTATVLDDQDLLLACVLDGDTGQNNVLAVLPLIKTATNTGYALRHRYTTHYSLLLADDDQQQILTCLAHGVSQLPLHSLLLEPVALDDSRMLAFKEVMETAGYSCEYVFRFYNWILRLHGQCYAQYMADRPSRLRSTISRKQRKLEREHGYEIRLYVGQEVPSFMPDYYTVYTASWKANEQYVSFLDGVVAALSTADSSGQGWSRLAVLYVRQQPVAAQLWFVLHGKANIFRLAYDEDWKAYSPGSILTSYLMAYVIDTDKVQEIDFLSGNDAYKQDWMSERRERYALSFTNKITAKHPSQKYFESFKKLFSLRSLKR
ncbi:MAG: GNAT family N-acetyltransferase [Gammaproteobacteria bacterium]|nr:GNAT family N-acetyltransferase [Gammaproteobacteria bacterium]